MTTESKDLLSLVEKLRQEQEFVSFYKTQIRQGVQDLNDSCNRVFHSLWLGHTLSCGLSRVLAHQLQCAEWSIAYERAETVEFVDASRVLKPSVLIERYSQFLSTLLTNPSLLSEVLHWVESEGLDTPLLINDLMSVVYGHCVFQRDHMLFLQLLEKLMKQHILGCVTPKDLFSGVEPVFSSVLVEYCRQMVELRIFLTDVFHDPLMQVLACEDYLEFDVNKAGSRFQSGSDTSGPLVDTGVFLFSEDLETLCDKLAKLAMMFLDNLAKFSQQFPLSLKWLLGSLKLTLQEQWPGISPIELRRPVSDMLFSSILGSSIVNPDSYGMINSNVVVGPVARYNLSQISSVLQGCAWLLDRPSGSGNKYPIHKVVKRMNMKTFVSLVDTIDGGYGKELLDLPSYLPGIRRSAYLASQEQLDNLVGLFSYMGDCMSERDHKQLLHSEVRSILSQLIPMLKDRASPSPYVINSNPVSSLPPKSFRSRLDSNTLLLSGRSKTATKRSKSDRQQLRILFTKNRSNSTSNLLLDGRTGATLSSITLRPRTSTQFSSTRPEKTISRSLSQQDSPPPHGYHVPAEVLIFPTVEQGESSNIGTGRLWDFDLLSEEEFMGQRSPSSASDHRHETKLTADLIKFDDTPPQSKKDNPPKVSHQSQKRISLTSSSLASSSRPPSSLDSPKVFPRETSPDSEISPMFRFHPSNPLTSPSCCETESLEGNLTQAARKRSSTVFSYFKESPGISMSSAIATGEHSPLPPSSPRQEVEFLLPDVPVVDRLTDTSDQSMENLLEISGGGGGEGVEAWLGAQTSSQRKVSKFRKLRERFGKKKHKSADHKDDLDSQKPRSTSKVAGKENIEIPKARSQSELSPQPEEYEPAIPPKALKKRRSYTMLTGHITAKYQALEARRRSEEEIASKRESAKTKKYENVRFSVVKMTPERFRRTLYCNQLKYKLRFALQNIHTSLTTSPVYLQLCADEDSMCDSRYQLIILLQSALQRSKWRHDDMGIALLMEILRMVEPLPNGLVAEILDGVHREHEKRSVYIAYLVRSHQKFQDAKLQVAAVQTSMNRMKQVQEDLFVNFMVGLFLESRESDLEDLTREMSSLVLADEKCSLMESYLELFTDVVQESAPWLHWSDMDQVIGCLDDHLFAHVYSHIFHPNGDSDMMRDQIFSEHLTRLSNTITPTHKSLQIPIVYHSTCPWISAQKHLKAMTVYKSPRGKLHCIVQSCKILISLLQYARCGDPPGADDMFPVLVYILIKSNPPSLLSTIQYIRNFAESKLGGEDAYWWAQFSTAVEFTKTLE